MGKNSKRNARRQPQNGANTGGAASFSQEEIWDDSALIRSWNDALQEYEYYHSIHAKGEDVEEVLRRAEAGDFDDPDVGMDTSEWRDVNGTAEEPGAPSLLAKTTRGVANAGEEIEEGELEESSEVHHSHLDAISAGNSAQPSQIPPTTTTIGPQLPHPANGPRTSGVPAPAQDETLENLKMAYYWAGYYSGLYDGQQQAKSQSAPQP